VTPRGGAADAGVREPHLRAAIVRYRLIPEQSKFTVQAFAEGLFSAFGHDPVLAIKDFTGEAQFVPGSFESASLKITIKADSIVVSNEVREKDRLEIEQTMREQVLEIAKYPEIVFVSSNISVTRLSEGRYRARIIGDLTFHGVTRAVEGHVTISAPDERSLLIEGEQVFDIREFGVEPPKILMFRVHPDVRVRIKVVAQQEG